ncbi:MAG TPA: hypothetical protein VIH63_09845 [Xanthobacteraceae bacterium]
MRRSLRLALSRRPSALDGAADDAVAVAVAAQAVEPVSGPVQELEQVQVQLQALAAVAELAPH